MMVVLLFVVGIITFGVPVAATVLVSVASRCEDSAWTLSGPPPGPVQAAARRIVGFHGREVQWPQPQGRGQGRSPERTPAGTDIWSPSQAESGWPLSAPR